MKSAIPICFLCFSLIVVSFQGASAQDTYRSNIQLGMAANIPPSGDLKNNPPCAGFAAKWNREIVGNLHASLGFVYGTDGVGGTFFNANPNLTKKNYYFEMADGSLNKDSVYTSASLIALNKYRHFQLGLRYYISRKRLLNPFLGASVLQSKYTPTLEKAGVIEASSFYPELVSTTLTNLAVEGGLELMISRSFALVFEACYQNAGTSTHLKPVSATLTSNLTNGVYYLSGLQAKRESNSAVTASITLCFKTGLSKKR